MGKQTLTKVQVKTMLKSLNTVSKTIGKVTSRSKKLRVPLPDVSSMFGKSFKQATDKLQKYIGAAGGEKKVTKYKTMLLSKVSKKISSLKAKYAKLAAKEKKVKLAEKKKKAKAAAKAKAKAVKAKAAAKKKAAKAKAAAKPKKAKKSASKPKSKKASKKSAKKSSVPAAFHYNLFGGNEMLRAFEENEESEGSEYEFQ